MSGSEGIGLMGRIAKLRRDTPRNGDVLAVCAALERLLTTAKPVDVTARPNVDVTSSCPVCERGAMSQSELSWQIQRHKTFEYRLRGNLRRT